MMTSDRDIYVYLVPPGSTELVTAGRFRWRPAADGGFGQFVYGRRYRDRRDAVELDPVELRLSDLRYETARNQGFFGAIRDAMPDYWGRLVIERRAGRAALDEFTYLELSPEDRPGALEFGSSPEPPASSFRVGRAMDLSRLQAAADAILDDAPDLAGSAGEQAELLLLLGTSMGGARPKVVIEDGNALWIAKLGRIDDRWSVPRVECALLELARICGIAVPDTKLVDVAGRDALLVGRFDRTWSEVGYQRHRMVSALTLLRAEESALQRARWSYLELADELRRVSASPREDLRELFTRMCFNAAVSNTDDHPRNHAIIAHGVKWRLSPAYDLTPTPAVSRDRRDLAMVCGRWGRWANRSNLLSEARRFLLSDADATGIVDEIVETVCSRWHETLRGAGVSATDCEKVRRAFVYDGLFYEPD